MSSAGKIGMYSKQELGAFLALNQSFPDDTLVEIHFINMIIHRPDGSHGPPVIRLGRLREEFIMRVTFPHTVETRMI